MAAIEFLIVDFVTLCKQNIAEVAVGNQDIAAVAGEVEFVGKRYLTGLRQGCPFLSEVGFRPQSRLGRVSRDRSFESDDLMFWDVRPGLCRDVVPLAHESF